MGSRRRLLTLLGLTIATAGLCLGAWWILVGARYVTTDNAYAAVETAQLTPAINGTVGQVHVTDGQAVKQGDVLVELDTSDARLTLEEAEAALDSALRRVRGYQATDTSLAATVEARRAELASSQAELSAAQADCERMRGLLRRREAIATAGANSVEELSLSRSDCAVAEARLRKAAAFSDQAAASLRAALADREANRTLLQEGPADRHPEVAAARARRDRARIDMDRTVLRAPVSGIIARRQVQAGQRVSAGAALLTIVPVDLMHVDANFKETQLAGLRIGQPVTLTCDRYGSGLVYHGRVEALGAGTGAAFALIPAQNATGNWIKVVQRLPVRISLDPAELAAHPLQVGLSLNARVDTRQVE
jgi:membrane fusion protein (multidrug efflux system)